MSSVFPLVTAATAANVNMIFAYRENGKASMADYKNGNVTTLSM